jgi:hypothetical protein
VIGAVGIPIGRRCGKSARFRGNLRNVRNASRPFGRKSARFRFHSFENVSNLTPLTDGGTLINPPADRIRRKFRSELTGAEQEKMRTQSDWRSGLCGAAGSSCSAQLRRYSLRPSADLGPAKKGHQMALASFQIRVNGGHVSHSNQIGHEWRLISS